MTGIRGHGIGPGVLVVAALAGLAWAFGDGVPPSWESVLAFAGALVLGWAGAAVAVGLLFGLGGWLYLGGRESRRLRRLSRQVLDVESAEDLEAARREAATLFVTGDRPVAWLARRAPGILAGLCDHPRLRGALAYLVLKGCGAGADLELLERDPWAALAPLDADDRRALLDWCLARDLPGAHPGREALIPVAALALAGLEGEARERVLRAVMDRAGSGPAWDAFRERHGLSARAS